MKNRLKLPLYLFVFCSGTLFSQQFMSKADLHDLKEIERTFDASHSVDLIRNKFAIHDHLGTPCLSLVAKTKNNFSKNQIEAYGGSVHLTVNGLATFNMPLARIHEIKNLEHQTVIEANLNKAFQLLVIVLL